MVKHDKRGGEQDALPLSHLSTINLSSSPSLALAAWSQFLEYRVTSAAQVDRITIETADHYRKYARMWWDAVVHTSEDFAKIPEATILARTDHYFKGLANQNLNTCRTVRSLIVGSFLPWSIEAGFCHLSPNSLLCLAPLPFHKYNSPIAQKFLEDSPSISTELNLTTEESLSFFRFLHYWIATRHLGCTAAKIKVDARPLLQSEIQRAEGDLSKPSPSQWLLSPGADVPSFLASRKPPFPKSEAATLFQAFIEWGKGTLPVGIKTLSEKDGIDADSSPTIRAYAPKLPPAPLIQSITERRANFSRCLQRALTERDLLIDYLIQEQKLSLAEIAPLQSPPPVDVTLQPLLDTYTAARRAGLLELRVNPDSPQVPFFVSADGGSLVVTENPVKMKRTVTPERVAREGLTLISELIHDEQIPFGTLRIMSYSKLRDLSLSTSLLRSRIESYARLLHVSGLRFYSIAKEGPGYAFPAVDGEPLTADE